MAKRRLRRPKPPPELEFAREQEELAVPTFTEIGGFPILACQTMEGIRLQLVLS